jgi:hypothetical protein
MRSAVVGVGLLLAGAAAAQVRIEVDSATVERPGDETRICVRLDSGGAEVAATENRLVWDGTCATGPQEPAQCEVSGEHDKQLFWDYPADQDFAVKALILSLTEVGPIPDGRLYCCAFAVEAAPGQCCPLSVVDPGASDPAGNALEAEGNTGQLCVAAAQSEDDDGCQVGAPRGAAWLGLAGALLLGLLSATSRRDRAMSRLARGRRRCTETRR